MHGRGVILRIDLSTEKITREPLSPELCRKYVGGEGINTYLFWQHFLKVDPKIDPTSPDNVLIWGMGPLGGTAYGAGSKSRWTFKGPAYGLFADSTSGGAFGPQMRWAGYDHLVITGKARRPVYIWIHNDDVEIRDAGNIWGKLVSDADDAIKEELGDNQVETACIGPAGENLVTYASLAVSRYRAAGRTGAGCVFGSKNLKAIAARGTKGISIFDRKAFFKSINAELATMYQFPEAKEQSKRYGTMRLMVNFNDLGWNAFHNAQSGQTPHADVLSGDWYLKHMQQRPITCSPSCSAACQAWHYIKGDESPLAKRFIGGHGHRPEYGMVNPFGASCDIPDLPAVAHLSELCNEYGIDIIEVGSTIAFMMELWQRGIITQKDMVEWTGEPLSLEWGNYDAVEKLLGYIATQKNNLGEILREVGYQAGKKIEKLKGVPVLKYANYGKGGSPQGESMRSRPQLAFGAAVAAVGGHHLKGTGIDEKGSIHYFGKPDAGNVWSYTLKGPGQVISEIYSSMNNSLGGCKFGGLGYRDIMDYPLELFTNAIYALTGLKMTAEELLLAGKRAVNMQKAFNSRLGLRREDDSVCYRWMYEPMTDGPGKGMKMADFLEQAKDEYYEYHGWDKATSLQKRKKLEELDLKDVADALEKEGALAKD